MALSNKIDNVEDVLSETNLKCNIVIYYRQNISGFQSV